MNARLLMRVVVTVGLAVLGPTAALVAQPAASPLDAQGLDQQTITGGRSRGMGGTAVASANDASALFCNPAMLSQLTRLEIRAGADLVNTQRQQTQNWVPLKTLPGISILFEGLSRTIKSPTDSAGNPLSRWSTFQKQYDDLSPNWKKQSSRVRPFTFTAAMPLTLAGFNIAAGLGVAQVMNLDHEYQNNNAMTPYLGQERPYGQWSSATDTLHVKWYQYVRSRDGAVYGVTPGVAVNVPAEWLGGVKVTAGASLTMLYGSSDDLEQRVERGHLTIAIAQGEPKSFLLDTVYYHQTKTGTSTYRGKILTLGLHLQTQGYSIGVTVKPSMALTRTWDREVISLDTTAKPLPIRVDTDTVRSYHENGKEYVNFPLSYAIGIVVRPTPRWFIAFDYAVRNLSDVELSGQLAGTAARPWVNNKPDWRLGAEYRVSDLLVVRGGYRQDVQAFAPDGAALVNDPAVGDIYALGAGLAFDAITFDLAYEYANLKYQDIYQSNVNFNTSDRHTLVMELAYRF